MFSQSLSKALSYYDRFNYLTIIDQEGVVEYSVIYNDSKQRYANEEVTGKHILEIYPELDENSSSILRALRTGETQYDIVQELTYYDGEESYLLSSDFPFTVRGKTIGVISVSVILNPKTYQQHLFGKGISIKLSNLDNFITNDPKMLQIKEKIKNIAQYDSPVLIYGETGTGKDIIAQSIHAHSNYRHKTFISQNCAAIPSSLMESIFFGSIKGAFTGAEDRIGLFEMAKGSTLFLDEINSMDIGIQPKILRAIEEKKIRRIGDIHNVNTDVRIVSAMNVSPQEAITSKQLREDLFFRLGVVQIEIPPLRERKGDILLIVDYFIQFYNETMGKNIKGLSEITSDILLSYSWPGNVRELKNVIESAFNLCQTDLITLYDIPSYIYENNTNIISKPNSIIDDNPDISLTEKVENYEKYLIEEALKDSKNVTEAATKLKISNQLLNYKIKKYEINKI